MSIVALNNQLHGDLRVRPLADLASICQQHMLPVVVHEVSHVGMDLPVVFVKHQDTGQFQMVAVLGLSPGENLMLNDGQWAAHYVPAVIRNNPFKLIADGASPDQMMLGIDDESDQVSSSEGERLFDDQGAESDFLTLRKKSVIEYFENNQVTRSFVSLLMELELLAARNLTVAIGDDEVTIGGVYVVDEDKLNDLPVEAFIDLRTRGLLAAIYAHMLSLNQVRRLASRRAAPDAEASGG